MTQMTESYDSDESSWGNNHYCIHFLSPLNMTHFSGEEKFISFCHFIKVRSFDNTGDPRMTRFQSAKSPVSTKIVLGLNSFT